MEKLIRFIEKGRPFFEKVSKNRYLRALMNGFVALMPVVIFSSIFMLIAFVPNVFGFFWSDQTLEFLLAPYDYTMGFMGFVIAGTMAKSLTDSFNKDLPIDKQIVPMSTIVASLLGMLFLSTDLTETGITTDFLGTSGIMAAFVSAVVVVNMYYLFIKRNITINLPNEVPGNIASAFEDIMPFSMSIIVIYVINLITRGLTGTHFAQFIIELFQPLFKVADSYAGLIIIALAISFFWFIGIHGPSVVLPAINAIMYQNLTLNQELIQAGERAVHTLTPMVQSFIISIGGTGATFVVPYMFMWLAKSKRNKAVGKAAFIPSSFAVNEPLLFGAPLILNPVFFIPFMLAPAVNVVIYKLFVDVLQMSALSFDIPWTTPGPIGLVMSAGFVPLSFLLAAVILAVDFAIYYPFFKVYDKQILEEELENEANHVDEVEIEETSMEEVIDEAKQNERGEVGVLVLCAGGGTSRQLANSLNAGAKEFDIPLVAVGEQYGSHNDKLPNFDLVVLAPQVASNYSDVKPVTDKLNIKLAKTGGKEYISLTQDPEKSIKFVYNLLDEEDEE